MLVGGAGAWLLLALRPPPPPRVDRPARFTLRDVTLVRPGEGRSAGVDLVVDHGVVASVAAASGSADAADTAAAGGFVLPGLIDFHTHLPPRTPLRVSAHFALLYLAHGVLTVREAGDLDGTAVPALRRVVADGEVPGPRVFACGPFVGGGPPRWKNTVQLGGPERAEEVVAAIVAAGFDCVKSYEDLSREEIRALAAAAARHGLPLIGHVPFALGYEEALLPEVQHLLGVPPPASLERDHMLDRLVDWHAVDEARIEAIVASTLEHGIANTPTLVLTRHLQLYGDLAATLRRADVLLLPRLYREVVWSPLRGNPIYRGIGERELAWVDDALVKKKRLVRRLWEAGAELHLGTDVQQPFVVPGISLWQEMQLFAELGIPPEEVWALATVGAARALGHPELARLEVGAPADLLLFRRDPTADLAALDSLEAVVANGVLVTRKELDARIEADLRHFESAVFDRTSMAVAPYVLRHSVLRDY